MTDNHSPASKPIPASDLFIRTQPLLQRWQEHICMQFAKRPEMAQPPLDVCMYDMARNGWDDASLIAALNEKTRGRFSENPDAQWSEGFEDILHGVIYRALTRQPKSSNQALQNSVPILRFTCECAETREEAETFRWRDYEPPNPSPKEALKFAERILDNCAKGKTASGHTIH